MFALTYNAEQVYRIADVRTRVGWESKTRKNKQEVRRGINANAVVKEAEEQEEAQKPTRNKAKLGEHG